MTYARQQEIAVSNDGKAWTEPAGINNPIVLQPSLDYCHYSDLYLVFNDNDNQIELWYRFTDTVNHTDKIHYYLYYSAMADHIIWHIGLFEGPQIDALINR